MKSLNKILLVAVAALSVSATYITENKYILSKGYTVTILGTSNLHAWTETVQTVTGNCTVTWNADGSFNLDKIYLDMEVNSIKSTEGGIMNRNTYKALKADTHPDIIFTLENPIKAGANAGSISANGFLSIAGVTKPISMQVKVVMQGQGNLSFEGSETILMTDFGIDPPTALFGTLKTGNEITIKFKTNFSSTIN